jgi:hypothetical protein
MDASTLQKINQYKPASASDYTEADISTFDILASNNLLHSTLFRWSIPSLVKMKQTYLGKPLMFDHQWENVTQQVAFVYDSVLFHYKNPSQEIRDFYLEHSPEPDIDSEILDTEGLYQLVNCIATETSHPITNEIIYGRKINASIGGLEDGSMICPICDTDFNDDNCPHLIPGTVINSTVPIAPYWIRTGYQSTIELSLVAAGNCPTAQVLNTKLSNLLFSQ